MDPVSRSEVFARFDTHLSRDGLRQALAYLLSLTNYRFIAIFRFEGGKANAAVFYDRQNAEVLTTSEVPDTATYCCFVRDSGGSFTTADSVLDLRLDAHPAREIVRAYCGVPVMSAEGELMGTLCHYDLDPRDPEQIDLELVLEVASAIAFKKLVPPYPRETAH